MRTAPTPRQVDRHFGRLASALIAERLPDGRGGHRQADSGEFMLMECDPINGAAYFKHRHTRNYLTLDAAGSITTHAANYDPGPSLDELRAILAAAT